MIITYPKIRKNCITAYYDYKQNPFRKLEPLGMQHFTEIVRKRLRNEIENNYLLKRGRNQ